MRMKEITQPERISRLGKLEEFICNLEEILEEYKSEQQGLLQTCIHTYHDGSSSLHNYESIDGMKQCEVCRQMFR